MKKYIISFTLVMIASLGYAQEKKTKTTTTEIAPMAAPPEEGCTYCYQWNRDI